MGYVNLSLQKAPSSVSVTFTFKILPPPPMSVVVDWFIPTLFTFVTVRGSTTPLFMMSLLYLAVFQRDTIKSILIKNLIPTVQSFCNVLWEIANEITSQVMTMLYNKWTIVASFTICKDLFPLSPKLLIEHYVPILFPLLINQGYSSWFLAMVTLGYFVTQQEQQKKTVRNFLFVVGMSLTMSLYVATIWDMIFHGRFFNIIYTNTPLLPSSLYTNQMIINEDGSVIRTWNTLFVRVLALVLDIMVHPLLTYILWHFLHQSNNTHKIGTTIKEVFTQSNITSAYGFSRCWSIFHCWYNFGKISLFYFGHGANSENNDNDQSWLVVFYVMEGILFVTMMLLTLDNPMSIKVLNSITNTKDQVKKRETTKTTPILPKKKAAYSLRPVPVLIPSGSGHSLGSINEQSIEDFYY